MVKILPALTQPHLVGVDLQVHHIFATDPYEPGAYHTIFPYDVLYLPPWCSAWVHVPRLFDHVETIPEIIARGMILAKLFAALPWMVLDICQDCRFTFFGPHVPRWHIYRGVPHIRFFPLSQQDGLPPIPGFVQRYDDPPPVGFGPPA
jgi:hypothetical protein